MSEGEGTWTPSALEALSAKIKALLSEKLGGDVRIEELAPLAGGVCQDNLKIELEVIGGPNGGWHRYVLRSDAPSSLPGSLRRREEFVVISLANRSGVLTPAAHWLTHDLVRKHADAYFLDFISGQTIGKRVVGDPSLAGERVRLAERLAQVLATIHKLTPDDAMLPIPNLDDARHHGAPAVALSFLHELLSKLPEAHPALRLAARWLETNAPSEREVVLVHGDFRTGNFMVTRSGLTGVLDWELAHWGSPYEDLSWICVRDWRFGVLDRPVGGFGDRAAFYAAYARASGRAVAPAIVHWWEVLGNVRRAADCAYQGQCRAGAPTSLSGRAAACPGGGSPTSLPPEPLALSPDTHRAPESSTPGRSALTSAAMARGPSLRPAPTPDLERVAVARRAAEMEWEALRLIEVGPSLTRPAVRQ